MSTRIEVLGDRAVCEGTLVVTKVIRVMVKGVGERETVTFSKEDGDLRYPSFIALLSVGQARKGERFHVLLKQLPNRVIPVTRNVRGH